MTPGGPRNLRTTLDERPGLCDGRDASMAVECIFFEHGVAEIKFAREPDEIVYRPLVHQCRCNALNAAPLPASRKLSQVFAAQSGVSGP